jgi:hypothetical protein
MASGVRRLPVLGVSATTGIGTAITTTLPSGLEPGYIMLMFVSHTSASATVTTPAGWTKDQETILSADMTTFAFSKVWAPGDAAPALTASVSVNWAVDIICLYGSFDASGQAVIAASNSISTTVTPGQALTRIVIHTAVDATGAARTWTIDRGTKVFQQTNNDLHRMIAIDELGAGTDDVPQTYVATVSGSVQDLTGLGYAIGLIG